MNERRRRVKNTSFFHTAFIFILIYMKRADPDERVRACQGMGDGRV
jgi:hypothetical protein